MDTRGGNTWHTTTPSFWKARPAPNSSTGEGGWALWLQSKTQKGGHGGAGSSGGHGRWSSWLWPRPSAQPLQPEHFYPQKNVHGASRGIRSPPGLDTETGHTRTRQSTGQYRLDRITHRNRKPSLGELGSWGLYRAWRGVRGPLQVASGTAHTSTTGGAGGSSSHGRGGHFQPPALDESPWTRQDMTGIKTVPAGTRLKKRHS